MGRMLAAVVGIGVLVLIGWPEAVAAQNPATDEAEVEPETPFFDSLDVHVVNVDVVVTDRQGRPVEGLKVEDFELSVDGRDQAIANFYAVAGGRPVSDSAETISSLPLAEDVTRLDPVLAEEQRLYLIVYIDNLFIQPFNRNKVLRQVRTFLAENIGVEDRVMVVTFERSLHLRQPFTSDLQAVGDQLFEIEELSAFARHNEATRQRTLRNLQSAKTFAEAEPWVDFYAKERFNDLSLSIDGLKEIVHSLAGLPGRKALLYVSDGLPMRAGADLFAHLDQRFTHGANGRLLSSRYSARSSFRELVSAANSHRVAFYTLEAIGVRSHASVSAETRGDGGSQIELDIERDFNNQETLQMLAADTGGLAAFNTNNIAGALDRMGADFRSYYSLGFVPRLGSDGRAHSIDVEVKGRKLTVRHRRSFRSRSPESALLDQVHASLHHGWQTNPMAADLILGAPRSYEKGNMLVTVTATVPFRRVTLLPRNGHYVGRLRLVMTAIDEAGDTSTPTVEILPLTIPEAAIDQVLGRAADQEMAQGGEEGGERGQGEDIVYSADVVLRRGPHTVAIGLRDELSGALAILRRPVPVLR